MTPFKLCLLLSGLCCTAPAGAQTIGPESPDVAGGSSKIAGLTHEFAIGQVMSGDTYLSGLLIVTPGVIQPVVPEKTPGTEIAASQLQVFPDPVESTLFLQPAFRQGGTLCFALYDAAGRVVASAEAKLKQGSERQTLPVGHLSTGEYILKATWSAEGLTPRISGYKIQKLR